MGDPFLRRRLTIGRTPVSFGSSRTKEKPSLRWPSKACASYCEQHSVQMYVPKLGPTDRLHLLKSVWTQFFDKRCAQYGPIVLSKVQDLISKGWGFCYVKGGLERSVKLNEYYEKDSKKVIPAVMVSRRNQNTKTWSLAAAPTFWENLLHVSFSISPSARGRANHIPINWNLEGDYAKWKFHIFVRKWMTPRLCLRAMLLESIMRKWSNYLRRQTTLKLVSDPQKALGITALVTARTKRYT